MVKFQIFFIYIILTTKLCIVLLFLNNITESLALPRTKILFFFLGCHKIAYMKVKKIVQL